MSGVMDWAMIVAGLLVAVALVVNSTVLGGAMEFLPDLSFILTMFLGAALWELLGLVYR